MFDFPDAPTVGQTVTAPNGVVYAWNGTAWAPVAVALPPYAPVASPVFTGDPQAPTPVSSDADTSIATTAFVRSIASATTPLINSTAAIGTGTTWARADHVHPVDTSRYAAANPSNYQTGAQVTASLGAYYTAGTSDARYVYKAGDTITGVLVVSNYITSNQGYMCQPGMGGAKAGSLFNINWVGVANFYIDSTFIGQMSFVSDYRIKRDVAPLASMWDTVLALRPVSYRHRDYTPANMTRTAEQGAFIPSDDVERWGFIAHELQETLIPDAATGKKDQADCIQSPNVWAVVASLTRALQEAMARIEALERR